MKKFLDIHVFKVMQDGKPIAFYSNLRCACRSVAFHGKLDSSVWLSTPDSRMGLAECQREIGK